MVGQQSDGGQTQVFLGLIKIAAQPDNSPDSYMRKEHTRFKFRHFFSTPQLSPLAPALPASFVPHGACTPTLVKDLHVAKLGSKKEPTTMHAACLVCRLVRSWGRTGEEGAEPSCKPGKGAKEKLGV